MWLWGSVRVVCVLVLAAAVVRADGVDWDGRVHAEGGAAPTGAGSRDEPLPAHSGSEEAALLAFKAAIHDPLGTLDDWAAPRPVCAWRGVECVNGSVVVLALYSNNFGGTIAPELGQLARLQRLGLSSNRLSGTIPPELGQLVELQVLNLSSNRLSGPIPREFGALSRLQHCDCSANQLSGTIPPEISRLGELRLLSLSANQLSGTILPELGSLAYLERLFLLSNRLTGTIPPELGRARMLTEVYLGDNQLTGTIPPELGKLEALEKLYTEANALTGPIPPELAKLSRLHKLILYSNQLTGTIPPELGQLSQLEELGLSSNLLRGSIPPELGTVASLVSLGLSSNALSGSFPPELGALAELSTLALYSNPQLRGPVPAAWGGMRKLELLWISNTGATSLPAELASLSLLRTMLLMRCQLTGLPDVFDRLPSLVRIDVSGNAIRALPPSLGHAQQLTELFAYENAIAHELPSWLRTSRLRVLGLSDNALHGTLPAWLGEMPALRELHLHGNRLHGTVPGTLSSASALRVLALGRNQLHGTLPPALAHVNLTRFDCSSNALHGEVPFGHARPATLESLRIANNAFSWLDVSLLQFRGALRDLSVEGNRDLVIRWSDVSCGVFQGGPPLLSTSGTALSTLDVSGTGFTGEVHISNGEEDTAFGLGALDGAAIINLSHTRSSGDAGILPKSVHVLDISHSDVSGVVITDHLQTLRMTHMTSFEGVPRVTQQRAGALEFLDARSAGMYGDASFLEDAHRLVYLYATDNAGFRNASAAVVYTRADHAREENRGLPRLLRFSQNYAQVTSEYSCPLLESAGSEWSVQVAQLDPSYYGFSACMCAAGMYGVPPHCIPCPDGAVCDEGSTTPLARDGFWGEKVACTPDDNADHCVLWDHCDTACTPRNGSRIEFFACTSLGGGKSACHSPLGSDDDPHAFFHTPLYDGEVNECAAGYEEESRVCTRCEDGWFKSGTACKPCPRGSAVLLPIALVLGIALLYGVAFAAAQRTSTSSTPRRATLSILILHLQLLGLMKQLGTPLPNLLRGESESSSVALFTVPALECVVDGAHFEGRLLVAVFTPLFLTAVSALIFVVGRAVLPAPRRAEWTDINIGVLLQMLTFAYMPVCVHAFQALPCEDFGGRSFMLHAPDVPCGSAAHHHMVGVAVVAIVLFVLGGPLLVMWRVWAHHSSARDEQFERRFGQLTRVYRDGAWFWKGVYYLRAVLITLCLAVISPRSPALGSVVFGVLAAFLIVQQYVTPFRDDRDNTRQHSSLVIALFSFYATSQFFAHGTSGTGSVAVDVLAGLVNIVFVGVLALELSSKYAKRGHRLAAWLLDGSRTSAPPHGVAQEMRQPEQYSALE